MSINFSILQDLTIPEGVVSQIADASGRVLWSAMPGAFAVLNTDGSMVFYKRDDVPAAGNTYNGKTVSKVYTCVESTGTSSPPWYDDRTSIVSVSFAEEISPVSCACWFRGCSNLTSFDGSNLDTTKVTNMAEMFYMCSQLTSLNLSNFNTANVTNMTDMFDLCSNLTSLDISSFNPSLGSLLLISMLSAKPLRVRL